MSVSDGTFFKTSSVLEENHSRLSKNIPRYLYSSTIYHRFLLDDSGDCLSHLSLFGGEGHNHLLGLTYVEVKDKSFHAAKSCRAEL